MLSAAQPCSTNDNDMLLVKSVEPKCSSASQEDLHDSWMNNLYLLFSS